MFIAIFVAALAFVIMFHEFGHFATAKAFGMKAERFFLGFGPTLWSFRRGETEYGVKVIPAGGFVKIAGMSRFEDSDAVDDDGRLFYQQAAWKRVIVLVAGSATHFVLAFVLLFAGLAFIGLPTGQLTPEISSVLPDSPADEAGLQAGDVIVALDGEPIGEWEAARADIQERAGETVAVTVSRDGGERVLQVELAGRTPDGVRQGYLGVVPSEAVRDFTVAQAFQETLIGDLSIVRVTGATVQALTEALSPDSLAAFFGQVGSDQPRSIEDSGIASLVGAGQAVNTFGSSGNILAVLLMLASLNIVFGVLNMLPLPPLDGGHVAVLLVEESVNGVRRLRGERERWYLDPAVITPVALAVIAFFAVVGLTAIYVDITNPIFQ
ncbi:MAG: PDZ domain-containing protein [Nitriliruptorales bacterium]|nr:PDZ domain-containing protein [Nitriliruptorales bacterium]